MTAPAQSLRPEWYRKSGIVECDVCEGNGSYWNGRGLGGNDPDSWDIECQGCDGVGHFPCATCGNEVRSSGYDCIVCDTVWSLSPKECDEIEPDKLAAAFAKCLAAVKAGGARSMTVDTHRRWRLYYEPTPIPVRDFDWTATHPDYDAWTDDGVWTDNGLKAFAATREELCAEIDAIEDERAEERR